MQVVQGPKGSQRNQIGSFLTRATGVFGRFDRVPDGKEGKTVSKDLNQETQMDNTEKAKNTPKAPAKEQAKKAEPARSNVGDAKSFMRGVSSEMKRVHWPTRQEVLTYTSVVLVSVVIVAAMIFVVDEALGLALQALMRR